jgi:hypothetical protein
MIEWLALLNHIEGVTGLNFDLETIYHDLGFLVVFLTGKWRE